MSDGTRRIETKNNETIFHAYFEISDYMALTTCFHPVLTIKTSDFSLLHLFLVLPFLFWPFYWIRAILLRLNRCILCLNTVCSALFEPQISFSFLRPIRFNQTVMPFRPWPKTFGCCQVYVLFQIFTPTIYLACAGAHHKFNSINRTRVASAHRAHHNN